jgi:hypothetical protein
LERPYFDEEHKEFGWFGLAGIVANDMNVVGALIECLSRRQGDRLSAFDLHHDSTLEYVNKHVSVVLMDRVRTTRRFAEVLFSLSCTYFLRRKKSFAAVARSTSHHGIGSPSRRNTSDSNKPALPNVIL